MQQIVDLMIVSYSHSKAEKERGEEYWEKWVLWRLLA